MGVEDSEIVNTHSPNVSGVHLIFADAYILLLWLFLMIIAVMDLERLPQYRVVEWQALSMIYVLPRMVWGFVEISGSAHSQSEDVTLVSVRVAMLCLLMVSAIASLIHICRGQTATPASDASEESRSLIQGCGRHTPACGGRPVNVQPPAPEPEDPKKCGGPFCCAPKKSNIRPRVRF